jgi:CBS domain-containing protein
MSSSVELTDPSTTIRDVAKKMRSENIGAMPVGQNDRLIGMVTDRDIVTRAVAEERSPGNTTVKDVMSEGICYCFEDEDVSEAAAKMAKYQVRRLPVLNRDKRLVGVVALADIGNTGDGCAQSALQGVSKPSSTPRNVTARA